MDRREGEDGIHYRMAPKLLIALSAHGFGHIGQTAPVVQSLRSRIPDLQVIVRSSAPVFKIHERFGPDIECHKATLDIGMLQRNALEILIEETGDAYEQLHADWPSKVAEEARALALFEPDLVLANIPYLTLAGARLAGIPAVAMCSLNWAVIYRHYFEGHRQESAGIITDMLEAYNSAVGFLQPQPHFPMPDISVGRSIGPVAQIGRPLRAEVLSRTGAHHQERIVMVSLGGMDVRLPIEAWSNTEGLQFIVPRAWEAEGDRLSALEDLALPFADVMASCDALIAKPGYGSFVEAACLGIPVLYVDRPNWPEVPYVVRWLEQHGRCKRLGPEQVTSGPSRAQLHTLLDGRQDPVRPTGVQEAADYLASLLG